MKVDASQTLFYNSFSSRRSSVQNTKSSIYLCCGTFSYEVFKNIKKLRKCGNVPNLSSKNPRFFLSSLPILRNISNDETRGQSLSIF